MAGRLALAFALALVTTQPVLAQSPEAPTATFMQSSKVEVMGGVGGIPEIANSSWYFTPTLNVAATIWATEHWGAGVWYINATAEVEYLANKWYRDQFSISQLSLPLPAPNSWKPNVRIHRRRRVELSDMEAMDRAHHGE